MGIGLKLDMVDSGKVVTVLGCISPDELGVVMPHEQMLLNLEFLLRDPEHGQRRCDLENLTFELKNIGKIRQYPYSVRNNLVLDSEEDIIEELILYKQAGGGTLCDVSPSNVRIKASSLPDISRSSGVHIVCGTGYYVEPSLPAEVKNMTVDEMAAVMVNEVRVGVTGTNVRCGLIGEIGCSWPLTSVERKVLCAAAKAQRETGAPLLIHPGRAEEAPFEIVDVLREAGGDISRTVMSHLDRTILSNDATLRFAKTGCGLEYDLFGTECSHYQSSGTVDMPSDAQRIQKVKLLYDNGYINHVFISNDIHTKHRQVKYGGHGYGHILNYVIHKMVDRGIPVEAVRQMTVENTKKLLTFE